MSDQARVRLTLDIEGRGRFQQTVYVINTPEVDQLLGRARDTLRSTLGFNTGLPLTGPSFIDIEGGLS